MNWTVDFDAQHGFVRVVTSGIFTVADLRRMTEDVLGKSYWRPGIPALFDHRQLDLQDTTFATVMAASQNHLEHDRRIGDGKQAIIMSATGFASGRQFELLLTDRAAARLKIFRDDRAAIDWLLR